MPFPTLPRVIYDRNPIVEVVCQIRFPTLLRIEAEPPVEYQEAIREAYPFFNENEVFQFVLRGGEDSGQTFQKKGRVLEFISRDEKSKVSFSKDFIAYSSETYQRWEDFRLESYKCFSTFLKLYGINTFKRIGLMYKNNIGPSHTGETIPDWGQLLIPAVSGIFSSGEIENDSVARMQGAFTCTLSGGGNVNAFYGPVESKKNSEFAIEADFFSEETVTGGVDDAFERLDDFNKKSGSFFRWCISDLLHQRLGPNRVE